MRTILFLSLFASTWAWAETPPTKPAPTDESSPPKAVPKDANSDGEIILKMGIESGRVNDHGRDTRVFTIPVICGDAKTHFTWGCGGQTIISAWFADKARIEIHPNEDLKGVVDGDGKPLFLGDATVEIIIGGKSHATTAWIMRDGQFNKNVPGVIGYEIAKKYQWEIDPRVPQITLRTPGALPTKKVLATLPLKDDQDNLWIHVKVRNAEDDVTIMPQTPDFQVAPAMQKAWDMDREGKPPEDVKTYLGNMRLITMRGKDGIFFSKDIFETNFPAYLLGENPNARSAVGQSLLNRFVYSVDALRKEMVLIERISTTATKPVATPAAR